MHVRSGGDSAAHRWSEDVRRDVHSVAEGVCVLAAATAADEGLFDVDAPVSQYLPDGVLGDGVLGDGVDAVTTRHLLGMISGIDLPWSETMMTD